MLDYEKFQEGSAVFLTFENPDLSIKDAAIIMSKSIEALVNLP